MLLTNSFRTGLVGWFSGAKVRVGYALWPRPDADQTLACSAGRTLLPTPAIDSYLRLAYAVGCGSEKPRLELETLPADETAADALWKKLRLPPGEETVVFNSGGAFGAAKHWPVEHFAALARRIATQDRLAVLVNCGPGERQIAAEIVRLADHPGVVSMAGEERLPIGLTKACIRRSRLLVSTDSGPRFFAAAFDVPVVSLFGPTHIEWSRTHYSGEICLARIVPCGPCMQRTCPLGHHQCMRDLGPEQVYQSVAGLLARGRHLAA